MGSVAVVRAREATALLDDHERGLEDVVQFVRRRFEAGFAVEGDLRKLEAEKIQVH